jgi:hypothetical protein
MITAARAIRLMKGDGITASRQSHHDREASMATKKSKAITSRGVGKGGCSVHISIHVNRKKGVGAPKVDLRMAESPAAAKKMASSSAPPPMTVMSGGGPGGGGGGGGETLLTIYIDVNDD